VPGDVPVDASRDSPGDVSRAAPGRRSDAHRQEIECFAERVGEELRFSSLSYQAIFRALEKRDDIESAYIGYLRERYFRGRSSRPA
jgi:hypothetical protein